MKQYLPLLLYLALLSLRGGAVETPTPVTAPTTTAPVGNRSSAATRLDELETKRRQSPGSKSAEASLAAAAGAQELIDSGALKTADDFYRTAALAFAGGDTYRQMRSRYELLLTATALGNADAPKEIAGAWDDLQHALGRPLRSDFHGLVKSNSHEYELAPASESVIAVLRDPIAARERAKTATLNPAMKKIVDADQADRRGTIKAEDWPAIGARDQQRERETLDLLQKGELRTAQDFANASLVMQHSSGFRGYEVAHELAVCSLLLGDRQLGRWLVAATYDRMLRSVGHDQRFATQYFGMGGATSLAGVDTAGICDAERVALGCPTLEEAKNRNLQKPAQDNEAARTFLAADGTIRDPKFELTASLPKGWTLEGAQRWGDQQNTLWFTADGYGEAKPSLYYKIYRTSQPMTGDALQDWYRGEAEKKEKSRREDIPDYRNRPASLEPCEVAGHPGFRWTADFTHDGTAWVEYMVDVRTETGNAFFFLQATAADAEKLRPTVDQFMAQLRLPASVR